MRKPTTQHCHRTTTISTQADQPHNKSSSQVTNQHHTNWHKPSPKPHNRQAQRSDPTSTHRHASPTQIEPQAPIHTTRRHQAVCVPSSNTPSINT